MLRILESQAPARQTATDTIATLSSRLSSATLLEDRRAAILGLRSFAKLYPASVASGALRDLIAGFRRDGDDSDTIKVVLETLLMLFEPDAKCTEASEEITLWLADEFTQRQDNITALLDLLETGEFYLRLYALQILAHVSAARPERTQEAVFAAPLGVSRITAVLDDRREAVRNEALLLLVALTPTSTELQKVVAFENAFERVFVLLDSEGGLTHGSTTVQDCLSLLANLLTFNNSNQSLFREIGCVAKIAKLLTDAIEAEQSEEGVSSWIRPQRDMNLWGLLAILQLFLVKGSQGTTLNQAAFWKSGILLRVLQLAFNQTFSARIRAKSLQTCGHIIRNNAGLQEQFGDLAVPSTKPVSPTTNGHTSPIGVAKGVKTDTRPAPFLNVIEALLELTLEPASVAVFDVRLAACNCMKAFVENHAGISTHVLRRAIEGHRSKDDAIPNVLTVLLEPSTAPSHTDPYQQWMAAVLLLHLLCDNAEAKSLALKVSEGDSENGEEVVTFIQGITSNVVAGVQHIANERALLGDLMLLCVWLFEDPDAVNDLLGEGSNVQGLITATKIASPTMPLVAGLCALLLGIVYEFSTKDSPVPRKTLHALLAKGLTRELYVDRLTKLRENVYVRDFEVLPQSAGSSGLPDVYFDKTFIDFLKDNFSRLVRAADRDPNFEVSVVSNGVQKGISRELVDTLRAELEDQKRALEAANTELVQLHRKFEQEELDHRRTRESSTVELGRIKQINQSLQDNHDAELRGIQQDFARQSNAIEKSHDKTLTLLRRDHTATTEASAREQSIQLQRIIQELKDKEENHTQAKVAMTETHRAEVADSENRLQKANDRNEAESAELKTTVRQLQSQLSKAENDHGVDLQTAHEEFTAKTDSLEARLKRAEERAEDSEARVKSIKEELELATATASARKDVQIELDDLLVVFADLEAKRVADKTRLKALGEPVSEDEDGEEEPEDNNEDAENSDID